MKYHLILMIVQLAFFWTFPCQGKVCKLNGKNVRLRLEFNENNCKNFSFERLNSTICFLKLISNKTITSELYVNNVRASLYPRRINVVPIYERIVTIASELNGSVLIDVEQIACPVCAQIKTVNFIVNDLPAKNCLIKIIKNYSQICGLQINLMSFKGNGYIEIGEERLWGSFSGVRNVSFTEFLIVRNATAMIKGRQQYCSLRNLNLLTLPVLPGISRDFECFNQIYSQYSFTIISPGFPAFTRPHECLYEIRKWKPDICRLRLKFHYFWLGDGYNGVCHGGHIEVDGYRFCGCHSGLQWTTSSYIFRDDKALLHFLDEGRDRHFSAYFITVEQVSCSNRRAINLRHISNNNPYTSTGLSTIPTPQNCPVPLVVITLGNWEGSLNSPAYPSSYPSHFLYRFQTIPGVCSLEIFFNDFDLYYTRLCSEEFVTFDNRRFCGVELDKTPIRLKRLEMWVSLSGIGRGFQAGYRQILCGNEADGNHQINKESTGQCHHLYSQPIFTIRGPYSSSCSFTIKKIQANICKLRVKLKDVDLVCGAQSLNVDEQYYCGRILEDSFDVNFINDVIEINLKITDDKYPARFTIEGEQLACDFIENQVASDCIINLSSSQGVVESPGLHPKPPKNLKCSYNFIPLKGICSIQLDFDQVHLADDRDCNSSYLLINNHKYCGQTLSKSTKVLQLSAKKPRGIPYMVDKNADQVWWNFTYTQIPC